MHSVLNTLTQSELQLNLNNVDKIVWLWRTKLLPKFVPSSKMFLLVVLLLFLLLFLFLTKHNLGHEHFLKNENSTN